MHSNKKRILIPVFVICVSILLVFTGLVIKNISNMGDGDQKAGKKDSSSDKNEYIEENKYDGSDMIDEDHAEVDALRIFDDAFNNKAKTITIPATVKLGSKTYKVVAINAKGLKGFKKLTKVTIGKNVTKIGDNAFYGCRKLSTITVKSTVLKSIGKNAIKGINKEATIKVPKKKFSKYKKLFNKKTGYKKQ